VLRIQGRIGRERLKTPTSKLPFFRQESKIALVAGFIPMAREGTFWPLVMLQVIEWLDD